MQLRWYQEKGRDAFWDYLRMCSGNPCIVLPTGAGKSPLMGALAMDGVKEFDARVGILAASQELVAQNAEKLRTMWPDAPMGIYAAGLRRRDRFDKVQYMQIQSVADKAPMLGRFDLLLIDEAQGIPLEGEGMYLRFIESCMKFNPHLRVGGLTATPYRLKGRAVPICGPDYVLNDIAYEARIPDLIADGYLSRIVTPGGLERANLSGVHVRGGEYVEGELAEAMMANGLVGRTMRDMLERSEGRRSGMVFCVNIDHVLAVQAELERHGEKVAVLYQGSPGRSDAISGHKSGKYRWLVNVNIASVGYDNPMVSVVAMLRPTKSPGLYYQQVGREFRVIYADGYDLSTTAGRLAAIAYGPKPDALLLDYAGNTLEHGPLDQIKVSAPKPGRKQEVQTGRMKECPKCKSLLPSGMRECDQCGHKFGSLDPQHSDRPVDAPILSTDVARKVSTHEVSSVAYAHHQKAGKPASLKVTYLCGMRRFSEWICIEHAGMARMKAVTWWNARMPGSCPRTVDEALAAADGLVRPTAITVDETDKFPEIIKHEFAATAEQGAEITHAASSANHSDNNRRTARPDAVRGMRGVPEWLLRSLESEGPGKRAA
jgi:DNA repair protein RadD